MRSKSGGTIKSEVVDGFIKKTVSSLNKEKPDAVFISLHGATVSESSQDVCGDILEQIRAAAGDEAVISASFDLHANITEKIMKNADYVCGYQHYPHTDYYETGYRAAALGADHLNGNKRKTVYVSLPMMAPPHGYTTLRGSLNALMNRAKSMKEDGIITDYSIFQVQPWMDIEKIASTIVVTGDDIQKIAEAALKLAEDEYEIREELLGEKLFTADEVIEKALNNKSGKPVVLVDSADSPNAGAPGDSAEVLKKLLKYKDKLYAAVSVTDGECVKKAFETGIGNTSDFEIGGTLAGNLYTPAHLEGAKVKSLHDGIFRLGGPAENGKERNIGKTAVLKVGNIFIQVCEKGHNHGDPNFFASFGIDPTLMNLVCVKACTSFRAAYESIANEICNTKTPGAACPSLEDLPFKNLPHPFYPFDEIKKPLLSDVKTFR